MSNTPVIVVLGSCSVDFTTYAPRLPTQGETIHGTKFMTSYGGKGANQCIAASKLGGNASMIARLGDDQWGHNYKDYLTKTGVDTTHTCITANSSTGIAQICVADDGENQIVIVAGANNQLSVVDVDEASSVIREAEILVGQLETPFDATLKAFKLNQGIRILNAAPARPDIAEILPFCTILCVNESEASLLTNISVDNIETAVLALSALLKAGCDTVIVTLGKDGAVYATNTDRVAIHVLSETVTCVDTTGAGDAFIGALATYLALYKGKPLHQVVGAACSVAAESVTKRGTQTSYPTSFPVFHKEYPYKTVG